jgi:5-methyltetrahydropteroyltriglutamate--homocysteine methyltransferase
MIRTTVVGSWPPAQNFADELQRYHHGDFPSHEVEQFLKEVAAIAIEQQCSCGLDEYTGGETSADSFILHFPRVLSGIEPTENRKAWDNRGTYRLVRPLGAPQGLGIASAYQRERALDPAIQKVTIPGPSEIIMMIESDEDRQALLSAAIELIRAEIQSCIALGATDIQLDLPHVAMGLVDGKGWDTQHAIKVIKTIFANVKGIRRSVHFCYGDFGAQTWTKNRNFHALLPTIQALGGIVDRVVLEFSLPEQWAERALLAEIPASMEIAVGIVDVKSPVVESPKEIIEKIEQLLVYVPANRLLICPSCGFGRRNVEMALQKTTSMVKAVAMANTRVDQG